MNKLSAGPYKLYNKIQNYEWGTKNENAFIPRLLGIEPEKDLPYGELWIGAHPKAPSEIEIHGVMFPLNSVIEKFPIEFLGESVVHKFGAKLPFLLKVLSAAQALSIQLHPNKKQAEVLHRKDPKNYPDDNHKPEIAIALDSLIALAGFRPALQIKHNMLKFPEIKEIAGSEIYEMVISSSNEIELQERFKEMYNSIMHNAEETEKLAEVIQKIVKRISLQSELSMEESQFLKQQKLYGNDVGLLSIFFFNLITLERGEAIFTGAGIPHAYILGNIVECMANSDNVVRAGLTNKFKDVDTLLDIIKYDFTEFEVMNKKRETDEIVFKTGAEEFEVSGFQKNAGEEIKLLTGGKPVVILIESGSFAVVWKEEGNEKIKFFGRGESFITPALLKEFRIVVQTNSNYYLVRIPD